GFHVTGVQTCALPISLSDGRCHGRGRSYFSVYPPIRGQARHGTYSITGDDSEDQKTCFPNTVRSRIQEFSKASSSRKSPTRPVVVHERIHVLFIRNDRFKVASSSRSS